MGHVVQHAVRGGHRGDARRDAGAITQRQAADAEGNGVWISWDVSKGRLHAPSAIRARKRPRAASRSLVMLTAPSWSPENIKVKELQTQLLAVRTSVICAMNQLLDLKDLNTGVHSTRLAEWAVRIGRDLGLDDDCLRDLEAAAILHDIGKIGVPDAILRKPAKLTEEEYAVIKKHPEYGWAVLRAVPGFERVSLFVLHHHEAFDGNGLSGRPARRRDSDRLAHRLGDGFVRCDGLVEAVSQGPAPR